VKAAVDRVVETCGLEAVTGKSILELSKGYKQRVGLAQAMVHSPAVLILDEPTSGLDPNQIVEVRSLIKRLGENHTVILSTHYLQEVENSCSRIIIISRGSIVANDTREALIAARPAKALLARIRGPRDAVLRQLSELFVGRVVTELDRDGEHGRYRIETQGARGTFPDEALAELVVKNGWALAELYRARATLEDVFRELPLVDHDAVTKPFLPLPDRAAARQGHAAATEAGDA
jgi:ABC-2 type transport system ATP-binding protein